MAWATAAVAIAQLSFVVLNVWMRMGRRSWTIPVRKSMAATTLFLVILFTIVSILDGLRDGLLPNGFHWFVWSAVALTLCLGVGFSVISVHNQVKGIRSVTVSAANEFSATSGPDSYSDARKATMVLVSFSVSIVAGLALYTAFLVSMGILELAYPDIYYANTSQVILASLYEAGMLVMGLGMQIGYAFEFDTTMSPESKHQVLHSPRFTMELKSKRNSALYG